MWPASASSPSEMSIIAVAPASAATGPGVVRRLRAPVGLDQHPRRAEPASEHGQPAGRPALAPGDGQDVAGLGARAHHRRDGARAEDGHRDHDLVGAGQVAADDARTDQRALLGEALREVERPLHGEVGRRGEPDGQRGGPAAHRVDVGEVLGGRAVAHVRGRRPSRAGSGGPRPSGRWTPPRDRSSPAARRRRRRGRRAPARPARTAPSGPRSARTHRRRTGSRREETPWRSSHQMPVGHCLPTPGDRKVGCCRRHMSATARSPRWSSRRTS